MMSDSRRIRLGSESQSSITEKSISNNYLVVSILYSIWCNVSAVLTVISGIVVDGTCLIDKAYVVDQGIRGTLENTAPFR